MRGDLAGLNSRERIVVALANHFPIVKIPCPSCLVFCVFLLTMMPIFLPLKMKSSILSRISLTQFLAMFILLLFISQVQAANVYQLDTSYSGSSFFDGFDFFTVSSS